MVEYQPFGKKFRVWRELQAMSMKEMAMALNMNIVRLSDIERSIILPTAKEYDTMRKMMLNPTKWMEK